jgi:hypothetical protein
MDRAVTGSFDVKRKCATLRVRLRLKPRAIAYTGFSHGTVERSVRQALNHVGVSNVRAARKVLVEVAQRLNEF